MALAALVGVEAERIHCGTSQCDCHRDTTATWRRSSARTRAGTFVGGLEIICAATRAASPRSPLSVILGGSSMRHGDAWYSGCDATISRSVSMSWRSRSVSRTVRTSIFRTKAASTSGTGGALNSIVSPSVSRAVTATSIGGSASAMRSPGAPPSNAAHR